MILVQATTWLRGGGARTGLHARGLGRFDDYFEDFQTTPLDHPTTKHGTHNPVWLTNTDNVLVSEGAGAGLQERPQRIEAHKALQAPRGSKDGTMKQVY